MSPSPPQNLGPGQSGAWDEDCSAAEDDEGLQWTLELYDESGALLYPPLTFTGGV